MDVGVFMLGMVAGPVLMILLVRRAIVTKIRAHAQTIEMRRDRIEASVTRALASDSLHRVRTEAIYEGLFWANNAVRYADKMKVHVADSLNVVSVEIISLDGKVSVFTADVTTGEIVNVLRVIR
jgi:hypothetical protein